VPLRVLVDAVSARVGGGGTHVVSQLGALDARPEITLTVYATGAIADDLVPACPRARVVREPSRPLPLRLLWEQSVLARRAREHDVVYAPGNFGLLRSPRPQVVAQQKIALFAAAARRTNSSRHRARLLAERALARASIRRADRVVAVSRSMAEAIEQDLGPIPHLRVVPSASPVLPSPEGGPPDGLPRPYVLAVTADLPHKDWDHLVSIFAGAPELPPLVIAGASTPERVAELEARAPNRRVVFLGTVRDRAEIARLYAGSACLVAHSRYESFGLTPLEALSLGVPVAASDIPAHREACGEAVHYYAVDDVDGLVAAVRAACDDEHAASANTALLGTTWPDNASTLAAILREAAEGRLS
jgi:glycosyltransferase involved in cell wall biosynthesis